MTFEAFGSAFAFSFFSATASSAGFGRVLGAALAGVASRGALVTAPMAGAPGGAAMSSTRYMGGNTTPPLVRATTKSDSAARWRTADIASGPFMLALAARCVTAAPTPAR